LNRIFRFAAVFEDAPRRAEQALVVCPGDQSDRRSIAGAASFSQIHVAGCE
jgi:hypothetical protein